MRYKMLFNDESDDYELSTDCGRAAIMQFTIYSEATH